MPRRQQKAVFAKLGNPSSDERITKSQRDEILKREFPKKDFDGDGVKNIKDCSPSDASKQDRTTFVSKTLAKGYAAHKKSQGFSTRIFKKKPTKGKLGFYSIDNWVVVTGKKRKRK